MRSVSGPELVGTLQLRFGFLLVLKVPNSLYETDSLQDPKKKTSMANISLEDTSSAMHMGSLIITYYNTLRSDVGDEELWHFRRPKSTSMSPPKTVRCTHLGTYLDVRCISVYPTECSSMSKRIGKPF